MKLRNRSSIIVSIGGFYMDDIKTKILDKSKIRFSYFGFKKTTLDEIAQDCCISKKTIYKYFKDKEDLFTSLVINETLKGRKMILDRVKNINDPVEWIEKFFTVSIEYFMEDNFLTKILRDKGVQGSPFLSVDYYNMIEKDIIGIIADAIKEGKSKGKVRDLDETVIAYACFKLFQALSYARSDSLSNDEDKQEYYINSFLDFIKYGLLK